MRQISPLILLALGACTVGPDYAGPPRPLGSGMPASFARARADAAVIGQPALADWWTMLGDPILDELEKRALSASPSLAITQARLEKARSGLRLEKVSARPNISGTGIYLHGDLPPSNLGVGSSEEESGSGGRSSIDLYNLGFDASWEIDLFGGQRRRVEAAKAGAQAAEAKLADAQLSLSADVARSYAGLREQQQRLAANQRLIAIQRELLDLLQQRATAGVATQIDLEQQRQAVTNAEAALIPIEVERTRQLNVLAVLTGAAPGSLDELLAPIGNIPMPPAAVPVGDPEALLRRRPDIRAAERTLASQTARIGVAEAARFPKLSFMGVIGLGGSNASDALDPENLSLLTLPRLQWNFLDFGRNTSRIAQARADNAEASAQYQDVVLRALEDAETALVRFGAQRKALANAEQLRRSALRTEQLSTDRYKGGTLRLSDRLEAERKRVSAEEHLTMARSALVMDFIALQKALGLGWQ